MVDIFIAKKEAYLSDEKYAKVWARHKEQMTFTRICKKCYHPYGDHMWGTARCPKQGC